MAKLPTTIAAGRAYVLSGKIADIERLCIRLIGFSGPDSWTAQKNAFSARERR